MLRAALTLASVAIILPTVALTSGCETTPSAGRASMSEGSVPLALLNRMYAARTAMTSLADGSATNPAEASATVASTYASFAEFNQRLKVVVRGFDDADPMMLFDELSRMGTIYQINTSGKTIYQLQNLRKSNLRGFRVDVQDLQKQIEQYTETYQKLLEATGPTVPMAAVQQNVPLVNQLTQQSVALDRELQDFSEALRSVSSMVATGF